MEFGPLLQRCRATPCTQKATGTGKDFTADSQEEEPKRPKADSDEEEEKITKRKAVLPDGEDEEKAHEEESRGF